MWEFFSILYILLHLCVSLSLCHDHSLDYCSFVVSFEIKNYESYDREKYVVLAILDPRVEF